MERDNPWNDDTSWWQQQDLEMQEKDEAERIAQYEKALAELKDIIDEELEKVMKGLH
jgi:hypothetical protein